MMPLSQGEETAVKRRSGNPSPTLMTRTSHHIAWSDSSRCVLDLSIVAFKSSCHVIVSRCIKGPPD